MSSGQQARHLAPLDSTRVLTGNLVIPYQWIVQTVAGTATYNMFNSDNKNIGDAGGLAFRVANVRGVVTGGAGVGTIVINHVASDDTASAITDVANVALFADTEIFDFSEIDDVYMEVARGQNLQIVTTANSLALITVDLIQTA